MERVLVIQTAFLGDAILGTALLERIRAYYPDCRIDYLIRKGNESLFHGHPFLNQVLVLDKSRKLAEFWRLLKIIRSKRYDAVFNAQRFAFSGMLTALSTAGRTIGYANNPLSFLFTRKVKHRLGPQFSGVHEVDRLLDLYDSNYRTEVSLPKIYPTSLDVEYTREFIQKPFVTMAPASVWHTKQWPEQKWVELIETTPSTLQVFLIGGPSDDLLCQRIATAASRPVSILSGKLSLLQTAALMQRAQMNYANDSAPVHLASAVNAPICEIFCSTIPQFGFTPLSETSYVIETEEMLSCRPCGIHGHRACLKGHFNCANINVERLTDLLPV